MNEEKIRDFITCYSKALNLSEEHKNILNELIVNLVEKYSKEYTEIPVSLDDYDKYVIKPENGRYSIEDFFLNRLMRNVWEVTMDSKFKGDYDYGIMNLRLNAEKIKTQLSKLNLPLSEEEFNIADEIARKKVIMHEFEHALQTRFFDGELDPRFREKYEQIIEEIQNYKNGKYANIINSYDYLKKLGEGKDWEGCINTGLHYTSRAEKVGINTYREVEGFDNLNEIFNETESLEMAKAKPQLISRFKDGSYYRVSNMESSNYEITNYGYLLKILLGEKETFEGMYFNPEKMFEIFNRRYNDVFSKNFGNNKSAWENLIAQINIIKTSSSQEAHLLLQKTLVECFDKKINHDLGKTDTEKLNSELLEFRKNIIWSDDKEIRDKFEHVQVLRTVREKIEQQKNNDDKKQINSPNIAKNRQDEEKTTSDKKKKFVSVLIDAYNLTEDGLQYDTRVEDEKLNMNRVEIAIRANGVRGVFFEDLVGKWRGVPSDEDFKVVYSQKQVSAMVRLLKAAELLTQNKKLNPEGRNYLEEFINIPDVDYKLKQMKNDYKDNNSYVHRMIEKARNDKNPSLKPQTPVEKEVLGSRDLKKKQIVKDDIDRDDR